jgi:hypothetical protein
MFVNFIFKQRKTDKINLIKDKIRENVKKFDESNEDKVFTFDDLMEIERDLKNNLNKLKNYSNKGSRFSRMENLQHEVDMNQEISTFGGTSEEVI